MRKQFLLISLLLGASWTAQAAEPLLTQYRTSGHTPEAYLFSETCDVYTDHVAITHDRRGIGFSEIRTVSLTGDVPAMIARAARERVVNLPTICDAAARRISASYVNGEGVGQSIVLESRASCQQDMHREGDASTMLVELVKRLCGDSDVVEL